jgi:maltokinase
VIEEAVLAELLRTFLPQQRWFPAKDREIGAVEIAYLEVLQKPWPALLHVLADVAFEGGTVHRYQVLVGVRPDGEHAQFLHSREEAVLGHVETDAGPGYAYDALLDHELGVCLLGTVAPDEEVRIVRPAGVEQSNTSLIYDDRLILKVFRRIVPGRNPDVEVTSALASHGFAHVPEPVASWRQDDFDLAVLQRFLAGGAEGWALALTSLRDLYASDDDDPADVGGDFADEARRLGDVTADLHIALAEVFGRHAGDKEAWAEGMAEQVERVRHSDLDHERVRRALDKLGHTEDAGPAIRVHGDYHLGQVMRTDSGWYVLDFEGEPARPLDERARPTSPLKDVAGMLRSFDYASQVAMVEWDEDVSGLARAWEARNRDAFMEGYLGKARAGGLLPEEGSWTAVLAAFELDKAIYELAYEQAHRPDWVHIPLDAINRILEAGGA